MNRIPPTLDMTPDGAFRRPPPIQGGLPLSFKLVAGAMLVAVVAGSISIAALALWVVATLLPVAIFAAFGVWAALRFRRWQLARAGVAPGPLRGAWPR